jgi:type II secretory ATPase GspE/PulE/Tfp pilus assembly ATPase PilB-like protein
MTAAEEVKKPSVKKKSLLKLKDFLSDLPTLRKQAYKEGMLSLRLSGAQKIAAGITTVKEILRVTPDNRD